MSHDSISRRSLLKGAVVGIAAVPAASLVAGNAAAADPPFVDPNDPQAKSLGYIVDAGKVDAKANPTFKPGQVCDNCIQYVAKNPAQGTCNLFPGKVVKAKAWCRVWVKKP